jgi:hypothetical protein
MSVITLKHRLSSAWGKFAEIKLSIIQHHVQTVRMLRGESMPYEAKQKGDSEAWEVINSETKEVKATHEPPDAQDKAERQVRLLNEIEHDEGWGD